jgi:glycine/sarcosine N-methyltransferase
MSDLIEKFYDDFADDYHLIFGDWDASIKRQSNVIDKILQIYFNQPRQELKVYDCSCGIGTQAIGIALLGYKVHASDISNKAISRAEKEAKRLGAHLTFGVADFRSLEHVEGKYNIIISFDNSLPHLLNDRDLKQAINNIRDKLVCGGLFIASIRDYDHLLQDKPKATLPIVHDDNRGKRIVFQVWDWEKEDNIYTLEHFIVQKHGKEWITSNRSTRYRGILRSELSRLLAENGFTDIVWYQPEDTDYYQPIVVARRI